MKVKVNIRFCSQSRRLGGTRRSRSRSDTKFISRRLFFSIINVFSIVSLHYHLNRTDIAINNEIFNYWRVGLRWDKFPKKLWPNRTIPYAISPLYEPEDMVTILTAINTIRRMTCLKFPKWNGKQSDFLLIWPIKYPKVAKIFHSIVMLTCFIFRAAGVLWEKLVDLKFCRFNHLTIQAPIVYVSWNITKFFTIFYQ